jgi:hypothetical protein
LLFFNALAFLAHEAEKAVTILKKLHIASCIDLS